MSTLYRKYRPQTFKDVIGQNHIKITLQNELERGEIGHAYLFCGPRGLGKTTLARLFAKAVNCQNRQAGESEPCNKCDSCLALMSASNIDIIEIDAASHTGVDNVRENIIENARFTPNKAKYKVFIIDEVHMLSLSAFNALLKTLEEPPSHAIFILATTEVHKLPQTILSRCQRFDLKRVSAKELTDRLKKMIKDEGKEVDDKVVNNIVVHSDGCVRDAESLLGKILTLGDKIDQAQAELVLPATDYQSVIKLTGYLADKNANSAIELINSIMADGVDLNIFVGELLEFWRKLLLLKVGGDLSNFGIELDDDSLTQAQTLATKFDYGELVSIIDLFMAKASKMKLAVIVQLPLELAVVEICYGSTGPKPSGQNDSHQANGGGDSVAEDYGIKKMTQTIKNKVTSIHFKKEKVKAEVPLSQPAVEIEAVATAKVKIDLADESKNIKARSFVAIDRVEAQWQAVVDGVLAKNYTLSSLLKISRPLRVKDGMIIIGVKNAFYRDRLQEQKNNQLVVDVMSELLKTAVAVKGEVQADLEPLLALDLESIVVESAPASNGGDNSGAPTLNKNSASDEVMSMF